MSTNLRHIKCVVVGDGAVGKTCLLAAFARNTFPEDYIPTVFDSYMATVIFNGSPVQLGLWDTAGQDEYDSLRPLSYPGAHVFLICYSMVNGDSLRNVSEKWLPEIRKHVPEAKVVLVGCKSDLVAEKPGDAVKDEDAKNMSKIIKAFNFCTCSAKTQDGVAHVFDEAIRAVIVAKSEGCGCEL